MVLYPCKLLRIDWNLTFIREWFVSFLLSMLSEVLISGLSMVQGGTGAGSGLKNWENLFSNVLDICLFFHKM